MKIKGTSNSETILGTSSSETIDGASGDDIIYAGGGNDVLLGGSGNNTLYGQAGKDTFVAEDREVVNSYVHTIMDFTRGTDKIDVSALGISSIDQIKLILEASGTKDTFLNARYDSSVYGLVIKNVGKGTFVSSDFIFDTQGSHDILGTDDQDRLFGSAAGETIDGASGGDIIYAGGGNDILLGGSGDNTLYGQAGKDTFVTEDREVVNSYVHTIMDFTRGTDKIDVSALGISSIDQIKLILEASGTKDTFLNARYDSSVYGLVIKNVGKGTFVSSDFIFDTQGSHDILGTDDQDRLFGSAAGETIDGASGDDIIYAGGGNDVLLGGSGNNTLYGQAGKDTFVAEDREVVNSYVHTIMDFTRGTDKIDVSALGISSIDQIKLILEASGTKDTFLNARYDSSVYGLVIKNVGKGTFVSSDFIFDTQGSHDILGTDDQDRLFGSAAGETIDGASGGDIIYAGGGNDILLGGSGDNTLYGQAGKDTFVTEDREVVNSYVHTIMDFTRGTDKIDVSALGISSIDQIKLILEASGTKDTFLNARYDSSVYGLVIKNVGKGTFVSSDFIFDTQGSHDILGTDDQDRLFGSAAGETIDGASGGDIIYAGGGNDILLGGSGDNTLYGQAGKDTLKGADESDTLYGGLGADRLIGGSGADVFAFSAITDSTASSTGRDTIFDFSGKLGDRIDLSALDASVLANGNQAFAYVGTAAFSGKAGELRYSKASSDTYVYGDVDGDRKADFSIHLDDPITLTKGFFVL